MSSLLGLTQQSIPSCYAEMRGYTYLLASRKGGTLSCGVTSDLPRRIWEHREGLIESFAKRYSVKRLVRYEEVPWVIDAIKREKAIKSWPRQWKVALIERENPEWRDLYSHLLMF
jgi:putative endonuclease